MVPARPRLADYFSFLDQSVLASIFYLLLISHSATFDFTMAIFTSTLHREQICELNHSPAYDTVSGCLFTFS